MRLGEHWEKGSVRASIQPNPLNAEIVLDLANVDALTLTIPPGHVSFSTDLPVKVRINDGDKEQLVETSKAGSDRSWQVSLNKQGKNWKVGGLPNDGLRKRHGLQGPIDDAFLDSFVFVRPTGKSSHEAIEKWTQSELSHAIVHWRQQFRGQARVKDDTAVTDADIASSNLVLWGDPSSNAVLKKIADKLPIRWGETEVTVGSRKFSAEHHAPIAIYPNPLNSNRYVVLNSSFTYREYDYLNNARQVPKLPDWAIVDVRTSPNARYPGKVVDADFFDERWQLKPVRAE